jgi:hypothetical protein
METHQRAANRCTPASGGLEGTKFCSMGQYKNLGMNGHIRLIEL